MRAFLVGGILNEFGAKSQEINKGISSSFPRITFHEMFHLERIWI